MILRLIERPCVAHRVAHAHDLRFPGDVVVPIAGIGVIAEPLRPAAPALLLDGLEHVRHVARIVAGARHHVRALEVGLFLELAAEPQERRAEPELRALRDDLAPSAADDRPEDGARDFAHLIFRRFARLGGAVPQDHVTQLVGHDAGDLAFSGRRLDHPAVHEHRSARQGERIDLPHVHDFERVRELSMLQLGRDRAYESASQVLDVGCHRVVVQDWQLLADLDGGLPSELHVLFGGVVVLWRRNLCLRGNQRSGEDDRQHRCRACRSKGCLHAVVLLQNQHLLFSSSG